MPGGLSGRWQPADQKRHSDGASDPITVPGLGVRLCRVPVSRDGGSSWRAHLQSVFVLAALVIIFSYLRHYTDFAKRDPDRLQSEEYRLLTMRQMIAAKELRHPVPVETLPLTEPTENPAEPQARTEGERTPDSTVVEEEREP